MNTHAQQWENDKDKTGGFFVCFFHMRFTFLPRVSSFLLLPTLHPQNNTEHGLVVQRALEGLQPIKGSSATLCGTAAHKTKWYVCNLAQCLLTSSYSLILATAGGKGAAWRRSGSSHQGHFIITPYQSTTTSLTPIASSIGCYKMSGAPTPFPLPLYWESIHWELIHVSVPCPLFHYPGECKAT